MHVTPPHPIIFRHKKANYRVDVSDDEDDDNYAPSSSDSSAGEEEAGSGDEENLDPARGARTPSRRPKPRPLVSTPKVRREDRGGHEAFSSGI